MLKPKNTRSPTLATRSSSLPGTGPEVVAPAPVEAVVFWFEHAASRATTATVPRILMFIVVRPCLGGVIEGEGTPSGRYGNPFRPALRLAGCGESGQVHENPRFLH